MKIPLLVVVFLQYIPNISPKCGRTLVMGIQERNPRSSPHNNRWFYCGWLRNPEPVVKWFTPLFIGFLASFWWCRISQPSTAEMLLVATHMMGSWVVNKPQPCYHWIGWNENRNRKAWLSPGNIGVSCKCSLHNGIQWYIKYNFPTKINDIDPLVI